MGSKEIKTLKIQINQLEQERAIVFNWSNQIIDSPYHPKDVKYVQNKMSVAEPLPSKI